MRRLTMIAIAGAVLCAGAGTAFAQTATTVCGVSGAAACTTTTTSSSTSTSTSTTVAATTTTAVTGFDRTQNLGDRKQGERFIITNGDLKPGTNATATFDGAAVHTVTVGAGGTDNLNAFILEDGFALGLTRPVFAAIGAHNLALTLSKTPTVALNGTGFTANNPGVANTLVIQGTAKDGGPAKWTDTFTIVGPGGEVQGGTLQRTGIMVLRWSLLGAALIATGILIVLATRRRRVTA